MLLGKAWALSAVAGTPPSLQARVGVVPGQGTPTQQIFAWRRMDHLRHEERHSFVRSPMKDDLQSVGPRPGGGGSTPSEMAASLDHVVVSSLEVV
jgi:hypothetical protein